MAKRRWHARIVGGKEALTRYIPPFIFLIYHFLFGLCSHVWYRHPSRSMVVIGITGTKAKTTTALFLHAALSAAGETVGLLSTVEVRIGDRAYKNTRHMTMPGRGFVHRQLRKMVDAGCSYVILEVPSEGIRQFRDFGVWYDSVIFTNLAAEHLITHKTFERYRQTKGRLFKRHARQQQKNIQGKLIQRFVLLNADDQYMPYFRDCAASSKSECILFGLGPNASIRAIMDEHNTSTQNSFFLEGDHYKLSLPGIITVRNTIPAILLAKRYCKVESSVIQEALLSITLPGRLERIDEGQSFKVFCDYAHEPLSLASVYYALKGYTGTYGRVIMVIGAVGASRWKYNARQIGETVTKHADYTVITDVDPFFDDPKEIMEAVVAGAKKNPKAKWDVIPDRRQAIHHALESAKGGDVVIITGKGSEVTMEVQGESLPWDERRVIREEIRQVLKEQE